MLSFHIERLQETKYHLIYRKVYLAKPQEKRNKVCLSKSKAGQPLLFY